MKKIYNWRINPYDSSIGHSNLRGILERCRDNEREKFSEK